MSKNVNVVTLSNGEVHPQELCVFTHEEKWELREDCTFTSMEQEWALNDEVHTEFYGDTFIEGNEDVQWSEWHDEYINTEHSSCRYGYYSYGSDETYFDYGDCVYCNDNYYVNCDVAERHDIVYSDREGEYVHRDDYEDDLRHNNANYQSLSRRDKTTNKTMVRVGFEIEKEDDDACGIHYQDLYDKTGWAKENDGSLNDSNGYELVSPTFDLFTDAMDKDINDNEELRTLINADHSSSCGGHINISHAKYSPDELFEGMCGFVPLLYSMYEHRLDKTYSQAKKKYEYFYTRDKYSSFYIKNNRVELRLPPAVKSVRNLLWRRDLMRIIMTNINASEIDVLKMIVNQKSKLYKHLRIIYTQSEVLSKIEKFIMYSKMYNNKVIDPICTKNIKCDGMNDSINQNELGA
jgi:hypothetical protein